MNAIRQVLAHHTDERTAAFPAIPAWLGQYAASVAITVLLRVMIILAIEGFRYWKDEIKGNIEHAKDVADALGTDANYKDIETFFHTLMEIGKRAQRNRNIRASRMVGAVANKVINYFKLGFIKDAAALAIAMALAAGIARLIPVLQVKMDKISNKDVWNTLGEVKGNMDKLRKSIGAVTDTADAVRKANEAMRQVGLNMEGHPDVRVILTWDRTLNHFKSQVLSARNRQRLWLRGGGKGQLEELSTPTRKDLDVLEELVRELQYA